MADGGGPTEQDRSEGTLSVSEGPYVRGLKRFGYFPPGRAGFCKVTRRKGGTIGGRDRSNGYVHPKDHGRLQDRHRWQASSHRALLLKA